METADADLDLQTCEFCGSRHDIETMHSHVDVWLCQACDLRFREAYRQCVHEWTETYGEWEPGQVCGRCLAFVQHSDALNEFPLICDGWVPEAAL